MDNQTMFHCNRYRPVASNRRDLLKHLGCGFGLTALAALMNDQTYGATELQRLATGETAIGQSGHGLHHPAKAKSVIFLYMDGGPSQVDTFDPKPMLDQYNGQDPGQLFKVEATQFNNNGKVLASPWKFQQYGQSGLPVSDLFPNVATCADDLCVIRSMVSEFPEHTFANYFLHTGSGLQGRPSMGAWVTYGLGSENENLPGFVVINGGLIPPGIGLFWKRIFTGQFSRVRFQTIGVGCCECPPIGKSHRTSEKQIAID